MKTSVWLILVLNLFLLSGLKSQTIDHPTIGNLEVSYKQVEGSEIIDAESIKYFPQITIELKNEATISKLYLKMIHETNGSVIINVNYTLSSLPVLDQNGKMVFYKDEQGIYHITPSVQIPLNLYVFQLITEDQQGNQSEVFSETH